ncbi:MAG: protein YgfX [Rugosibacter sp.]
MRPVANRSLVVSPSKRLKYLLWLAHAVAACSIFLATLPLGARIVLLLVVLASWISHTPAILNYFSPQIKRLLKTGFLSCSRLESGAVLLVLGGDGQLKKVSEEARNIGSDRTAFSRVITATPITDGGNASHAESITLQPQTLVLPFLVVLLYRKESRSRLQALLVLSDSLSAEDFRYLRIWLRWQVKWHIETDA